jgi:hypothetical protein
MEQPLGNSDATTTRFFSFSINCLRHKHARGAKDKYELSTLSLFRERYKTRVIGLHKGASNFGIVYSKGCDWRSYATSDKKDKEGKLSDLTSGKVKHEDYTKYFDAAKKETYVFVRFDSIQATGEAPKDAQIALRF